MTSSANMPAALFPTEAAPKTVASLTGGQVMAIVPQTFDDVYRFAQIISKSGLAPYGMQRPEQLTVAILMGLEIGVKPMQAIQGIAVINGRPAIWGDLALAVVYNSMLVEELVETFEGTPPANWEKPTGKELEYRAVCRVKRRGQLAVIVGEYSIQDAITGKLWMKKGGQDGKRETPWVTSPKRMLKMRARGFALRDAFADVLKGMVMAEELEGTDDQRKEPPVPPGSDQVAAPVATAALAPPQVDEDGVFTEVDPQAGERLISEILEQCSTAQTAEDINEHWGAYEERVDATLTRTQRESLITELETRKDQLPTRKAFEEGRRQTIEGAGGKGIKEYMDEDRADAQQADDVAQIHDPFEPPAEGFTGEEHYVDTIRSAIMHATTPDLGARLTHLWTSTKSDRIRMLLSDAVAKQLHNEVSSHLRSLKETS